MSRVHDALRKATQYESQNVRASLGITAGSGTPVAHLRRPRNPIADILADVEVVPYTPRPRRCS